MKITIEYEDGDPRGCCHNCKWCLLALDPETTDVWCVADINIGPIEPFFGPGGCDDFTPIEKEK